MTSALLDGDLVLTGRIVPASNATFYGEIDGTQVVYKPVAGERPLWDFPPETLASREVAAFLVSQALCWGLVPETWLREGPYGTGMVQVWQHTDTDHDAVTLVPAHDHPGEGWCHVFDGIDQDEQPVSLIHEDTVAVRRIAIFDVLTNNADRKGSHVLATASGHRYAIDHGLTFHTEHKLRTVLWGWLGQPLTDDERDAVDRVRTSDTLAEELSEYLSDEEISALTARCDALLGDGRFPSPRGTMPAIPWPPL